MDTGEAKANKIKRAALFIFCGLPGLFVFLTGAFGLIFQIGDAFGGREIYLSHVFYDILIFISGSILLLVGVGKIKKWPYLCAFISFPIILFLTGYLTLLFNYKGKGFEWIILSGLFSFVIYKITENHYKKKNSHKKTIHPDCQDSGYRD